MKKAILLLMIAMISNIGLFAQSNVAKTDATNKKEKTFIKRMKSFRGVPIGTVISFAGSENNIPKNFLVCDGREVNSSEYRKLALILGTNWGGDGTPSFRIPDLRGRFIRGVDSGAGNDPDATKRTDANGNIKGDQVGTYQEYALKTHSHLTITGGNFSGGGNPGGIHGHNGNEAVVDLTNVKGVPENNKSSESRPVNAAIAFIIRVK